MLGFINNSKSNKSELNIITSNGITFIVKDVSKETKDRASKIAKIYPKKVKDIAAYMIKQGIFESYEEMPIKDLIDKLGSPTIDLNTQQISYTEHSLDDEHILSLEYNGDLERFSYFSIDG